VGRTNLTLAVKRLVRDAAAMLPELAHVRPAAILVVAGEARRASRATIRPAVGPRRKGAPVRPVIRVKGRTILYVITLRPLWFLASTPEERIATVLHELYHASKRFDGTLHRGRRHANLPKAEFDRKVRGLLRRYLAVAPPEVVAPFAANGTARARMWLERPAGAPRAEGAPARQLYTEEQLFYGPVKIVTPPGPPRPPSAHAGSRRARPS
jgi:predicted metallopeptidase